MSVYEKIIDLLKTHSIDYKVFRHEPVRTSEEAARIRGTDIKHGAKSLVFLADGKPILLVLGGNKRVDLKKVKQALNIKDLAMASAEKVLELTTVEVGGVPPLGTVIGLPTYLDQAFTKNRMMDFNAGDKSITIEMKTADYLTIVEPTLMTLSQI